MDFVLFAPSGEISVFLGDGSGGFKRSQSFTTPALVCEDAALADFDDDGFLDLSFVTAGPDGVWVCLGDRAGGFKPPVFTPAYIVVSLWPFRLDGDRRTGLLVKHTQFGGSSLLALSSNGDGTFSETYPGFSAGGYHLDFRLAIADVDGDGDPDVVDVNFGNGPTTTLIAYLRRPGGFVAVPSPAGVGYTSSEIVLSDLNADGRIDIAAAASLGSDSFVTIRTGHGDGSFDSERTFALPAVATSITAADLDDNGLVDLIASGMAGTPPLVLHNTCRPPHHPAVPGPFLPVKPRSRMP